MNNPLDTLYVHTLFRLIGLFIAFMSSIVLPLAFMAFMAVSSTLIQVSMTRPPTVSNMSLPSSQPLPGRVGQLFCVNIVMLKVAKAGDLMGLLTFCADYPQLEPQSGKLPRY